MKRRNHLQVLVSVFSSGVFLYVGPLSAQFQDWLGGSRIHLVVIIALAVASNRTLLNKFILSALLEISSLLLVTIVGDNGTLADGGIYGDWLLYQVLPLYANYADGLNPLYWACLLIMFISVLLLLEKDNG